MIAAFVVAALVVLLWTYAKVTHKQAQELQNQYRVSAKSYQGRWVLYAASSELVGLVSGVSVTFRGVNKKTAIFFSVHHPDYKWLCEPRNLGTEIELAYDPRAGEDLPNHYHLQFSDFLRVHLLRLGRQMRPDHSPALKCAFGATSA
jgi:hypothetical protein